MSIQRIGTVPVSFTCTAATRPSAPVLGQTIMVTDRGNRIEWYDGTNWRYGLSNLYDRKTRTAGNISAPANTNWFDIDTALDITLPAVAGDVIEVALHSESQAASGYGVYVDVKCTTSNNYFGTGVDAGSGNGVIGWSNETLTNLPLSGTMCRVLVSGDITAGLVTLRVRGRTTSASNGLIYGDATRPFTIMARNLGPCASGALTAN